MDAKRRERILDAKGWETISDEAIRNGCDRCQDPQARERHEDRDDCILFLSRKAWALGVVYEELLKAFSEHIKSHKGDAI